MKKFKTPVSMPCTMEQFNRDLKEKMEEMGYEEWIHGLPYDEKIHSYIMTASLGKNKLYHFDGAFSAKNDRIHLPTYNPDIFLAIAAMTEGDMPIVGEWVIAVIGENKYLARTAEIVKGDLKSDAWFLYGKSDIISRSKDRGSFIRVERKATVEEIIAHFDGVEQAKPIEYEFKFGERVLCWDEEGEKVEAYFVAKVDSDYPYLTIDYLTELDYLKDGESATTMPYLHCIPYPTHQTNQITVTATYEGDEVKEVEVDGANF